MFVLSFLQMVSLSMLLVSGLPAAHCACQSGDTLTGLCKFCPHNMCSSLLGLCTHKE